jgi:hypothetical protein
MKSLRWVLLACLTAVLVQPVFPQSPPSGTEDYSGMYSFVREGEFLQITIEEKGVVSGFISRFGDSESDKGAFLDQFFKSGKIEGNKVSFISEIVHGVSYKFEGAFDRGPGKKPENEGYYVLRGTLTRFSESADHKTTAQDRKVEFSSFPRDTTPAQ